MYAKRSHAEETLEAANIDRDVHEMSARSSEESGGNKTEGDSEAANNHLWHTACKLGMLVAKDESGPGKKADAFYKEAIKVLNDSGVQLVTFIFLVSFKDAVPGVWWYTPPDEKNRYFKEIGKDGHWYIALAREA